jgi:type I restriction enzyme M protein
MSTFTSAKQKFDATNGTLAVLPRSYVAVNGKFKDNIPLLNAKGAKLEEYYKWQFVYALINSGLYAKDYIGVEVHFPKGNKASTALKLDGAIFDDADWITHYVAYWKDKKSEDLEWLNTHLLAVIEFKRGDKEIEKVFSGQVKPAMKEKDPSTAYVLGIYYDEERLFLFHRKGGNFLRYDEAKNQKGSSSKVGDISLHLPDPYVFLPSYEALKKRVHLPSVLDRSTRDHRDLDIITSIATVQVQSALSQVLRTLDKAGLVNQRGYQVLIETFALKIFDEKRNQRFPKTKLQFYIEPDEAAFAKLADVFAQRFVKRMHAIRDAAE